HRIDVRAVIHADGQVILHLDAGTHPVAVIVLNIEAVVQKVGGVVVLDGLSVGVLIAVETEHAVLAVGNVGFGPVAVVAVRHAVIHHDGGGAAVVEQNADHIVGIHINSGGNIVQLVDHALHAGLASVELGGALL